MKVLYIGVYRDGTGWAHAAIDYILALDAAGVQVIPRPIKLNNAKPEIPQRIIELEQEDIYGCDIVIQNILPHMMDYNGRFTKNVGLYTTETSNFRTTSWADHINTMDAAWVMNHQSAQASEDSFVDIPIEVIPCATDITRFQRAYSALPFRDKVRDHFVFYFIGERNRRKNLAALIKAFNLEFDPDEPVELVIKTTPDDVPVHIITRRVEDYCREVKEGLRLYPDTRTYKREIVIAENYTEEQMMRLHASCDCFVMPSYGEAFCIPAFDAMAMGKTPIVTSYTGMEAYLSNREGWVVDSHEDVVYGIESPFHDLYTAQENCQSISVPKLRKAMRSAYRDYELREQKAVAGMNRAYDFTYEKIGSLMKGKLDV